MEINADILKIVCFLHWGMNKYKSVLESTSKTNNNLDYCVLVVEDDDVAYLLLQEILSSYKIDLQRAVNGEEAIDYFYKDRNTADLVFMDIRLPKVNGFEATRRIKELNPTLPIIAITAYAHSQGIIDCFNSGCDDYVAKPYDIGKILNLVENHLIFKN